MALLRIDIEGTPQAIPYRSFLRVANNTLSILDDLDIAFSHRRFGGATDWYMNDLSSNGKLRLEIYSKTKEMKRKRLPDIASDITRSFVSGFRTLETQGRSPAYLSEVGMKKAESLTDVVGHNGARAIVAVDVITKEEVEITRQSAINIGKLIPEASKSYGSIEGTLEEISIHKGNHFVVYESISGKGVRVRLGNHDLLQKVKDNLGSRILVSGLLSRNAKNEPISVTIQRENNFKVFGTDLQILPLKELGGSDPNFTGD